MNESITSKSKTFYKCRNNISHCAIDLPFTSLNRLVLRRNERKMKLPKSEFPQDMDCPQKFSGSFLTPQICQLLGWQKTPRNNDFINPDELRK